MLPTTATLTLIFDSSFQNMYKRLNFKTNPFGMQAMAFNVKENGSALMENDLEKKEETETSSNGQESYDQDEV